MILKYYPIIYGWPKGFESGSSVQISSCLSKIAVCCKEWCLLFCLAWIAVLNPSATSASSKLEGTQANRAIRLVQEQAIDYIERQTGSREAVLVSDQVEPAKIGTFTDGQGKYRFLIIDTGLEVAISVRLSAEDRLIPGIDFGNIDSHLSSRGCGISGEDRNSCIKAAVLDRVRNGSSNAVNFADIAKTLNNSKFEVEGVKVRELVYDLCAMESPQQCSKRISVFFFEDKLIGHWNETRLSHL